MTSRALILLYGTFAFHPALFAAEPLDSILAKITQSAGTFRAMSAKIRIRDYTAIIKDDSTSEGAITIQRGGPRELRMVMHITAPPEDAKTYAFHDRKAEIYTPKAKLVQEYDLGKNAGLVDQFLLLGFGTTGAELEKIYKIKLGGEETVGGRKTARLELTPKDKKAQEYLKQADLWVEVAEGRIVQQKFLEGNGNFRLVTYWDAKWNPELTDAAVRLDLPKDVKRESPQK